MDYKQYEALSISLHDIVERLTAVERVLRLDLQTRPADRLDQAAEKVQSALRALTCHG